MPTGLECVGAVDDVDRRELEAHALDIKGSKWVGMAGELGVGIGDKASGIAGEC